METYAGIKGIEVPELNLNGSDNVGECINEHNKACKDYEEKVIEFCQEQSTSKYAGKVITFPVADGKARYVVLSLRPLELIHINTYDGYHEPMVERMNTNDIKEKVRQHEALKRIFS